MERNRRKGDTFYSTIRYGPRYLCSTARPYSRQLPVCKLQLRARHKTGEPNKKRRYETLLSPLPIPWLQGPPLESKSNMVEQWNVINAPLHRPMITDVAYVRELAIIKPAYAVSSGSRAFFSSFVFCNCLVNRERRTRKLGSLIVKRSRVGCFLIIWYT